MSQPVSDKLVDVALPSVKELEKVVTEVNKLIDEVEVQAKAAEKVVSELKPSALSVWAKLKTWWVAISALCNKPPNVEVPALPKSLAPSSKETK